MEQKLAEMRTHNNLILQERETQARALEERQKVHLSKGV